jgi:hypothetical protein
MLEGLPTRKRNDSKICYDNGSKTYVLHAPRLYGDFCKLFPPGSIHAKRCADDPYEVFPGVQCTASMSSGPRKCVHETPDNTLDSSYLTLVWFQNEWAMPIAPEVLEKLKAFDWDVHAYDGWF